MVASRPTVMAPPRTSAAPRAFLAQWRARPHRRLVGVSVVCLESHEGRMIRAREAHQRLAAAFRDLDTDGSGFVDRPKLCAALESYGLPRGEDYVDELMAQYRCDEFGAITFEEYRTYAGARERATRRAWRQVLGFGHDEFPFRLGGTDRDRTGDDRNARADVHTVLEATKRAGIDGVDASDAAKMVSLLAARRGPNGSSRDAVTYEEFRRYAALLPDAQLRSGNAVWDWLAAAAPEREHVKPRGQRRKQLFAGGLAGIVGRTAVAPLDRARTIIQDMGLVRGPASSMLDKSGIVHTTKPPNAAQVCRDVLRNEGPAGLFRGNMVSALKVVPANALQFAIFHKMKDDFLRARSDKDTGAPAEQLLLEERLASGAVAGALSTAACYPLDTLKSQMAVAGGLRGSVVTAATQLFREQGGLKAFYKGIGPTLLCDVIGSALGFTLYETFQTMYREANGGRKPNPLEKGALGGLGACVSLTLTMPLEVVMTRMRVQGLGHRPVLYKNALECLKLSVQREGLKSLWLGTGAAYVKIFPQLAITYFVFELASEQLGVGGLGRYERSKPVRNKAVDEGKPPGPVAA